MFGRIPGIYVFLIIAGILLVAPVTIAAVAFVSPTAGAVSVAFFFLYFMSLYIIVVRRAQRNEQKK